MGMNFSELAVGSSFKFTRYMQAFPLFRDEEWVKTGEKEATHPGQEWTIAVRANTAVMECNPDLFSGHYVPKK